MDEQLQHLIDDCQRKRQAAHEAETRLWRHLAEVHGVEPHAPAPPRLPTDARRKQRLVICGVAGAVLVAVLVTLPLIFRGREAQAYARLVSKIDLCQAEFPACVFHEYRYRQVFVFHT